jgi:hypothetical protein
MDEEFSEEEIAEINEAWESIANDRMGMDLAILLSVQSIARFQTNLSISHKIIQMEVWMEGIKCLRNTLNRSMPSNQEASDDQEIH